MNEFEGFPKFWKAARRVWTLSEALEIYHECPKAWSILAAKLKREQESGGKECMFT